MDLDTAKIKKGMLIGLPIAVPFYLADKAAQLWRYIPDNGDSIDKATHFAKVFGDFLHTHPIPSFNVKDLFIAALVSAAFNGYLYYRKKNAKKFRKGREYGSARWGNEKDIKPYMDEDDFENNILLTQTERLTMGKPIKPKFARNMRDFDTSIFFKWIVKTEIALTLVGNAFNFVTLVFSEGATIASTAYTKIGVGALASNKNLNTALQETLKDYTNSKLLVILGLSFVTMIAVYALFVAIMVTLCSRTIEAVMYLSVAPIPMATFMNNEFRQVGNSWARGIFALAFQGFFIVVALAFFKSMFNGVTQDIVDKKDILFSMVKMCGYSVALIFTVLRTGQISKTLFSAH